MGECEYCGDEFKNTGNLTNHKMKVHFDSFEEKFWDRVEKGKPDECWEWQGHITTEGYGGIRVNGKYMSASRAYFVELLGLNISEDVFVCHECNNKPCVNPNHLYLGTAKDNLDDRKEVWDYDRDGTKNPNSLLEKEEVIEVYKKSNRNNKTNKEIAEEYGVSPSTVSNIRNKNRWQSILEKVEV